MAKSKKETVEKQEKVSNKIVIRYKHFNNPIFKYIMVIFIQKTYHGYNIKRSIDEKYSIKNYRQIETLTSVDDYKKHMQDTFLMFRILNTVKTYQKDFIQKQNDITQRFLKKNPSDKENQPQNIILEEDVPLYEDEMNKLCNSIVELNIDKISPIYFFMNFEEYMVYFTEILIFIKQKLGETTFYNTAGDGWNFMILYEIFEDFFNIDEIYNWKYSGDIDDFNKRIFFGN